MKRVEVNRLAVQLLEDMYGTLTIADVQKILTAAVRINKTNEAEASKISAQVAEKPAEAIPSEE